jgi:hypothetical protein
VADSEGRFVSVLKYLGLGLGSLVVVAIVGLLIAQRVSDGPMMGFIQGGPFKTGELVETPISDWSFAANQEFQFELVGPGTSRTAGVVMHDGVGYISCDLGFLWNRLEGASTSVLRLIYIFKTWHHEAEADGRAVIRVDGKRYPVYLVRVAEPSLVGELKTQLEVLAAGYLGTTLPPPPAEPPNDIWFFRVDPPRDR